MERRAIDKQLN